MSTTNGQAHAPPPSQREVRSRLLEDFASACAAGKPRTARRLLESFWLWDSFGGSDLWDRIRPRTNDGDGGIWVPPSVPSDRRHGSDWPLWRNQPELDQYRQQARIRARTNAFAQGMVRNLTNNVIGKGYTYKVQLLDEDGQPAAAEQLTDEGRTYIHAVQSCVDRFVKINHWNCSINPEDVTALAGTREREIYRTVQIDGEAFVRFHFQDDGTTVVRMIDAAQVRDSAKYLPQEGWTYGIQHQMEPFEDVETPLTYAVFWPDAAAKGGEGGSTADQGTWEEIDAAEVLHLKGMDTPSNIKRGLSLFVWGLGDALDRASRLQRNASMGAAIRSAIAETQQLAQATQVQIQNMAQALAVRNATDPITGRQTPVEQVRPGTVRRVPEGWELVQPTTDYTESYLTGKEGDLQEAAAGAGIAAFVLGGLESGNYSNFESASYPPVQNATCEQEYFKLAFARVVWKAIAHAVQSGVLPADTLKRVTLTVEAPAVLHRNELEKAQEDQISVENGWKDRQTCAAERGLDWHQVEANNEDYQKRQNELAPQPQPGQPGQPGKNDKPAGQNGAAPKPKMPQPKPVGTRATHESFDPSEPRDDEGKWASGGGGETAEEIHTRLSKIPPGPEYRKALQSLSPEAQDAYFAYKSKLARTAKANRKKQAAREPAAAPSDLQKKHAHYQELLSKSALGNHGPETRVHKYKNGQWGATDFEDPSYHLPKLFDTKREAMDWAKANEEAVLERVKNEYLDAKRALEVHESRTTALLVARAAVRLLEGEHGDPH